MNDSKKENFIITAFVKPRSKDDSISWDETSNHFIIKVKAPAIKGKANKKSVELVKNYFTASSTRLVKGVTSTTKIFEVVQGKKPNNL